MPTRDTPWPDGTPCWVDYGAADLDATKRFYASPARLGVHRRGARVRRLPDRDRGTACRPRGLGPQQDPNDPPRWTTYFAADDAAATAAPDPDAGGTVLVEPMEVGPMGTMVIALDPQGNPFGLWQSGMHTGVQIYNEPGALAWNEALSTTPTAREGVLHGRLRVPLRPDGRREPAGVRGTTSLQHRGPIRSAASAAHRPARRRAGPPVSR